MIDKILYPENYNSPLGVLETEIAIKHIKDFFEINLAKELSLTRVSAPLFIAPETGLNDNLNGYERPVAFTIKDLYEKKVEIVQSLAKWKRIALSRYGFNVGEGLYTDMNAIRRDEVLDNLHSIYVDQWDWEKIITAEERTIEGLKNYVNKIYTALKALDQYIASTYPFFDKLLPEAITFVTAQELEDLYPNLSPKHRENLIAEKHRAVFIIGIGNELKSGSKHDGRAPDYDDWNLNGDIILWNPVLKLGLEISSMGIRVNKESLEHQLELTGDVDRKQLDYHKKILSNKLPLTVGGGIGQSRLCQLFLRKAHIGEVQAAIWPTDMIHECRNRNIFLL
jgi:aspartate--ammonia ligase